jgi:hypothetical protein
MSLWKEFHSAQSARAHARGYGAGGTRRGDAVLKKC